MEGAADRIAIPRRVKGGLQATPVRPDGRTIFRCVIKIFRMNCRLIVVEVFLKGDWNGFNDCASLVCRRLIIFKHLKNHNAKITKKLSDCREFHGNFF